ncbi:hypothetical protein DFH05DRAFT_1542445 [Lentinula detonsa]|uniref:Uncharacterized protein n=1 Tax=Lentinula detonsa TaxID=2804962 RepID=A0A9W8P2R9_9AGAR|nr:hypothetical protein DFH05DRAFT_1542445 [Lentinula detonsa]
MVQRLKSIFHTGSLPPEISSLIDLYQDSFEYGDSRGTRISDALAFEDPLSEDLDMSSASLTLLDDKMFNMVQQVINSFSLPGVASRRVKFHRKIRCRDLLLSVVANNYASAQVVIFNNNTWFAAVIQRIFTATWLSSPGQTHQCPFALIIPYKPLDSSNGIPDPYSRFGFSGSKLFDGKLDDNPLVVPIDSISSHFTYTPQEHSPISTSFHALPLTKFPDFGAAQHRHIFHTAVFIYRSPLFCFI